MDCEQYLEILARGDRAAASARDEAERHAAACEECRRLSRSFAAFEAEMAQVPPPPRYFATRVAARLASAARLRDMALPWQREWRRRAWVPWAAAGAGVAAVASWLALGSPAWLAELPENLAAAATTDASVFGVAVGVCAAVLTIAGFVSYYFVAPTE